MKKTTLTLAIAFMAFSSSNLIAQRNSSLEEINKIALQHYQSRDNDAYAPSLATFTADGDTYRKTFTYDEELQLTEELTEIQFNGDWQNGLLATYEYGWMGLYDYIVQIWNGSDWENAEKQSYTYNMSTSMLEEHLYQDWSGTDWENVEKYTYTYNDNVTEILSHLWIVNNWKINEKYTITYGPTSYEIFGQYLDGGAWYNLVRLTYTLNDDMKVVSILSEDFVDNNHWENSERHTYNYENGVYTSLDYESWEGSWTLNAYANFEYDTHGNAIHGQFFRKEGGNFVEATEIFDMPYNYSENSVEFNAQEVNVYYTNLLHVEENAATCQFNLYPNPANDFVIITGEGFEKAELYNLTGQKLATTYNANFDVKALPTGVYMLKIHGNGMSEMRRIVVN